MKCKHCQSENIVKNGYQPSGFITLDETDFLKFKRKLGGKEYELTNHLGNVMAVVTDRKITVQGANITCLMQQKPMTDFYIPNVVSYSDYYPFGMQMPDRNDATITYRYGGAGGQETESEITGSPTHYSAEYWMYDSRLIRRWNRDPVVVAWESPYAAFRNNPIIFTDPNGDSPECEGCPDNKKHSISNEEWSENSSDFYYSTTYEVNGDMYRYTQYSAGYTGTAMNGIEMINIPTGANVLEGHLPPIEGLSPGGFGVISFTTKGRVTYTWNDDAQWYTTSSGQEWDEAWNVDLYNAAMMSTAGFLRITLGDGLKQIMNDVNQNYGGSYGAYFLSSTYSGVTGMVSDLYNGGHRAQRALYGIGIGATTSFAPAALGTASIIGNISIPVYRVYGAGALIDGASWTFVNPKVYGSVYRNFAGLPSKNAGNFMIKGSVKLKDVNSFRMAKPYDGNFGRLVPELMIYDFKKVNVSKISFTNF